MSRLDRLTACLVLGLYVLVSTFSAGFVLCAEPDGRVALETRSQGCCGGMPTPARHSDEPTQIDTGHNDGGGDDDCGDCVDRPLQTVLQSRDTTDLDRILDPADVAACVVALLPAPLPRTRCARAPPYRPPPERSPVLRTVRLLL